MHTQSDDLRGREAELARLRDRLHAAVAGHGGVVVISGEAGIGKSALAEAIAGEAERLSFRVFKEMKRVICRASPLGESTSARTVFHPVSSGPWEGGRGSG